MVLGAESSASGGQEGVTALVANSSSHACMWSGDIPTQLLDSSGKELTTSWSSTGNGKAWLVPERVALDPWWPQPGEATFLVSWHTGDVGPGQCSGSAPQVGAVQLTAPGGGTVTGTLTSEVSMAPCNGVVQLGPVTQATTPTAYASPTAAAQAAAQEEFASTIATGGPPASFAVTNGTSAAYVGYDISGGGGGCAATTYVWQDSAGWHVLDTTCVQNGGFNPTIGASNYLFGTAAGCVNAYTAAGHGSLVVSCVTAPPTGSTSTYTVDLGPIYIAETDPTSQLPDGTIWWHLKATGWVTQDFLVESGQG